MGGSLTGQGPGGWVIEFVGLPGAGKSTVAAQVADTLASQGWHCATREILNRQDSHRVANYGRLAQFFLLHPSELQSTVRLASTSASLTPLRVVQGLKYISAWSYRLASARRNGYEVVVLDQGVVQDAWSLLLRGPWRDQPVQTAVSRTILASGSPYALIYFDVDIDVAVRRIIQRPTMHSRFDHLDATDAERQLASQGERLEELFTRVVALTGVTHYRVNAVQPVEAIRQEIVTFLDAVLRPASEPKVSHR